MQLSMDRKDPGCVTCLWVLPARRTWLLGGKFMVSKASQASKCCSIYVYLWVLVGFENHAAEESCQETSEEVRECGTADTCSSSVSGNAL